MPILEINGRRVEVSDDFLTMSPEQQEATVDEIASQIGAIPAQPQQPSANAATGPEAYSAPPAPIPETFGQGLKVGTQAIGRGAADLLGTPVDLMTGLINAASGLANDYVIPTAESVVEGTGRHALGMENPQLDLPRIPRIVDPIGGSENIANLASQGAEALGYDVLDPETEMTPRQRLGYNIDRYGGQAGASAIGALRTALTRAPAELPRIGRMLTEAYRTDAPLKTVIGDTAGGAGAGTALHALDEYTPDSVKNNPIVRLLAALGGGVGGATLSNLKSVPGAVADFVTERMPVKTLMDPETGADVMAQDANMAARFMQDNASDPARAAQSIGENADYFKRGGGAMPTTGQMSDDIGMQMVEKGLSLRDPKPFAENAKKVGTSAYEDVARIRPEVEDEALSLPQVTAAEEIRKLLEQADRGISEAQKKYDDAQGAETALGGQYAPLAGTRDAASEALDKAVVDETMRPMQGRKNELFNSIGDATIPGGDMAEAIRKVISTGEGLGPAAQSQILPEDMINDFRTMLEAGEGNLSFGTLNKMRPVLSEAEGKARTAGDFSKADNLRALKAPIGKAAEDLAARGSDEGQRARDAIDYFQNEFAPRFGQGEGKRLRQDINADDKARSRTPPTKTASRFLSPGAGGKEKAADLQRILKESPSEAAGKKAARDYIVADLADTVRNGKVDAQMLRRWKASNQGVLSQFPDVAKEVDGILAETEGRARQTSAMKAELENAAKGKKQTEADIDRSALKLIVGRSPDNMVRELFGSQNPVEAVKEIRALVSGNVPAERGFKAAVADWLMDQVSTSGKAMVSDDANSIGLGKIVQVFKKNESALKEVFGDDMRYLQLARRRLEALSQRGVQAGTGSQTIENAGILQKLVKPYDIVMRIAYGALRGGSETKKLKIALEQIPDQTKAANDLLKRAMFDPEVAKHLLTRPLKEIGTPLWNRKLLRLMRWTEAARETSDNDER